MTDLNLLFITTTSIWLAGIAIASWNDSLDIDEDRISHPDRPIPSGLISIIEARIIGSIAVLFSLIVISIISYRATFLLVGGISIGISYSFSTKRYLFMKNMTVSFTATLSLLLLPWVFQKQITKPLIGFSISIALILFGYEILKDLHDIQGDKAGGIQTLPLRFNSRFASKISLYLFTSSCLIMALSFGISSYYPEMWISIVTIIVIGFPLYRLTKNPSIKNSDLTRIVVVGLLSFSLSLIAILQYNRFISKS